MVQKVSVSCRFARRATPRTSLDKNKFYFEPGTGFHSPMSSPTVRRYETFDDKLCVYLVLELCEGPAATESGAQLLAD